MAVDVSNSIVIGKPVEEVAAYAMDPDNAPEWYKNIQSIEWRSKKPLRKGSKLAFVAQFLGRRLAYTYEVVEMAPGERFVMRTAEGPFPMETTYEWRPVGDGKTEMTLRNRGAPSGFSAIVAPLMAVAMNRENRKDLESIRRILESR